MITIYNKLKIFNVDPAFLFFHTNYHILTLFQKAYILDEFILNANLAIFLLLFFHRYSLNVLIKLILDNI